MYILTPFAFQIIQKSFKNNMHRNQWVTLFAILCVTFVTVNLVSAGGGHGGHGQGHGHGG